MNNLARLLREQGKLKEAEPLLRSNLESFRRVRGPEHPETLAATASLGELLENQGKLAEAVPLYQENVETRRRICGKGSIPYTGHRSRWTNPWGTAPSPMVNQDGVRLGQGLGR